MAAFSEIREKRGRYEACVNKKGWRYIWVYSRPDDDKGIGTKAVAAYVARVYRRTSFGGVL